VRGLNQLETSDNPILNGGEGGRRVDGPVVGLICVRASERASFAGPRCLEFGFVLRRRGRPLSPASQVKL
jgi:hypothetical protein